MSGPAAYIRNASNSEQLTIVEQLKGAFKNPQATEPFKDELSALAGDASRLHHLFLDIQKRFEKTVSEGAMSDSLKKQLTALQATWTGHQKVGVHVLLYDFLHL